MREFLTNELEDIERRICELAEGYTDEWKDRYFEETPPRLDESGVNDDLDEYNRLIGERKGILTVWDHCVDSEHPEFLDL